MAGAAVDHIVSLTIFIAALLIFISLFSQNMQTGLNYQRHTSLSTKTSDLLDTILLNPGLPADWGQNDTAPEGLGLQDPEYMEYRLSSYSPMRLVSSAESSVYYPRTSTYYNNITAGFGSYLLVPTTKSVNNQAASKLLGINGTYGFQLALTPTVTVSIQKVSSGSPLKLLVNVAGIGYPLANAPLSYSLVLVKEDGNAYPSYTITSGVTSTDEAGYRELDFAGINGESSCYALLVYSYLGGLKGMGYYVNMDQSFAKTVVPLIDSFEDRNILIAHGDSLGEQPETPLYSELSYNASFVILTEEYTLRQVTLDQPSAVGELIYGSGSDQDFASITVPDNHGILIVTYKGNAGEYGLVLMPWGLGSLAFPLTFGGNPAGQEWVTTDIRQVTIGGVAYQAKLELWSLQGYSGSG